MVPKAFLELLRRTLCASGLDMMLSGILWCCLKEVKPFVVFGGEGVMALGQMQGNQASSRVELGYMELFGFAVVTSGSL